MSSWFNVLHESILLLVAVGCATGNFSMSAAPRDARAGALEE